MREKNVAVTGTASAACLQPRCAHQP